MDKVFLIFILIVIQLFFSKTVIAGDKDILEQKIKLSGKKETVYKLLKEVSDKSGLLLIYDSQLIDNGKTASVRKGEYTIREAVYAITGNRQIQINVSGRYILISAPKKIPDSHINRDVATENTDKYFTFNGILYDQVTNDPIEYGSVGVVGSTMGTITNQDGEFRLALPDSLLQSAVRFSHIGYQSEDVPAFLLTGQYITQALAPTLIPLQEIIVRVANPKDILGKTHEKRSENYPTKAVNMTVFYREGVKYKEKDISLIESVLQLYKTGIWDVIDNDQAELLKMRQIYDREHNDLLVVKVKSGIQSCFYLDLIKNLPDFLDERREQLYDYMYSNITTIDEQEVYIISFEQKSYIKEPLFRGELYINAEDYSLVQAVFEAHPDHVDKLTHTFIEKKDKRLDVTPHRVTYLVSYKQFNGIYYINHVRSDMHFKVRRKGHLFSFSLHAWFEMVNCMTETEKVTKIPRKERIHPRNVFGETKFEYDKDFWGSLNVIMQEDKLKESVLRMLEKEK